VGDSYINMFDRLLGKVLLVGISGIDDRVKVLDEEEAVM